MRHPLYRFVTSTAQAEHISPRGHDQPELFLFSEGVDDEVLVPLQVELVGLLRAHVLLVADHVALPVDQGVDFLISQIS